MDEIQEVIVVRHCLHQLSYSGVCSEREREGGGGVQMRYRRERVIQTFAEAELGLLHVRQLLHK